MRCGDDVVGLCSSKYRTVMHSIGTALAVMLRSELQRTVMLECEEAVSTVCNAAQYCTNLYKTVLSYVYAWQGSPGLLKGRMSGPASLPRRLHR